MRTCSVIRLKILRTNGEGETTTTEVKAYVGDQMYFPITTDVEEGDLVEYQPPSGKTRTVQLTKVTHNQSPFSGSGNLDHIAAEFSLALASPLMRRLDLAEQRQQASDKR
nr:hypothetical protein [uncultured bacterium]